MNFSLNEDLQLLQQSVRDFAFKEVAKGAAERDRAAEMPRALIEQLAGLGLFGITIPDKYGGAGMGTVASSIVVEEISKACAGTGVLLSAASSRSCDSVPRRRKRITCRAWPAAKQSAVFP
jgi:butyryl-CoA dehydrogenase